MSLAQVTLSYRHVDGLSKDERTKFVYFTHFVKTDFKNLAKMLKGDYIYSPFNFVGRRRGNDTVIGTTRFIVIDVDNTNIDIAIRHEQLKDEGLVHIIATTSNRADMNKYRVLLLLDSEVDVAEYKQVVRGVKEYGLIEDMDVGASIKAAGVMYAYKGSTIYSNFKGNMLNVADYKFNSKESDYAIDLLDTTKISNDWLSFSKAVPGSRSKTLLAAAFKMQAMGYSKNDIANIVYFINKHMVSPKTKAEVDRRVLNVIFR